MRALFDISPNRFFILLIGFFFGLYVVRSFSRELCLTTLILIIDIRYFQWNIPPYQYFK